MEHSLDSSSLSKTRPEGDLVCFLQGASKPTIIRPRRDRFVVIMIAAIPLEAIGMESVGPPELSRLIIDYPHEFLLIWDWKQSQGKPRNQE